MAARAVPAIPAPLAGLPLPKAPRVQPGAERSVPPSACQPFSHSQFPPFWGFYRPAPAPPPRSGQVLTRARAGGWEACSETRQAFPERPLQPVASVVPPESAVCIHADPSVRILTSVTRESFPYPLPPLRPPPLPTAEKWKDDIPRGDREKIRLPPSLYTSSYPAQQIQPAGRRWHLPRGCVPVMEGDGQSSYDTSYQAQFRGEWSPPANPSKKRLSPIKFGDPRISGSVSEQKHAYRAPGSRTHRVYDKERAASQIHRTNLQLGDGCTRLPTATSELFPVRGPEPLTTAHPNEYASSLPRGDGDPERNEALARTPTQLSYPETDRWNLAPKPDLLLQKRRSNICPGDERSGSRFSHTMQQTDHELPRRSHGMTADSESHRQSRGPFSCHSKATGYQVPRCLLPLPQPRGAHLLKALLSPQIKRSPLGLPRRAQDLCGTEQEDEFTPKSGGPAEIQKANSQVSCVPQGTLKGHCPQRKGRSAP
ncbi:TEX45 protein, partial [Corythaixoides concolor]|nr:TEX45 protein [Corythaixoides concolor]